MLTGFLSAVTLIVGWILGLISSYFIHRQNINMKIIDQYFEARKIIAKEIAPLTNIDLAKVWTKDELSSYMSRVSSLYYEHYDLLPTQVLEALMLLEICLGDPHAGPVIIRDGNVDRMTAQETVAFVTDLTHFQNTCTAICLSLQSSANWVRGNQSIKLQGRNVLHAMNRFSSVNAMYSLKRNLRRRKVRARELGLTARQGATTEISA